MNVKRKMTWKKKYDEGDRDEYIRWKKEDVYESVKMKNDEKVMRAIINVKNVFNCVLVFFLFNLRLS